MDFKNIYPETEEAQYIAQRFFKACESKGLCNGEVTQLIRSLGETHESNKHNVAFTMTEKSVPQSVQQKSKTPDVPIGGWW